MSSHLPSRACATPFLLLCIQEVGSMKKEKKESTSTSLEASFFVATGE